MQLTHSQELGIGTVCSLGANAAPHVLLAWMRRDLQKLQWRRVFHQPSGARLFVLRARRNAFLSLLTNCHHTDAVTVSPKNVKPSPNDTKSVDVRAPVTQALYNKYKCSGDMWSRMVLAYDHMANCESVEIATTQSLIHALTVQAFTYWRLATGSEESHIAFRHALLRHYRPTPRPSRVLSAETPGPIHCPVRMSEPQGRCATRLG